MRIGLDDGLGLQDADRVCELFHHSNQAIGMTYKAEVLIYTMCIINGPSTILLWDDLLKMSLFIHWNIWIFSSNAHVSPNIVDWSEKLAEDREICYWDLG